jgi:hypothetical protein
MTKLGVPTSWIRNFRNQGKEFLKDLHFFWRAALVMVALIFFLYAGTFLMLIFSQEEIIFRPRSGFRENLRVLGMDHRPMELDWAGGKAKAMLWEKIGSPGVLIFCYGNASNVEASHDRVGWLAEKVRLNIFVADYPGYGETPGEPSEDSIVELMGLWLKQLEIELKLGADKRIFWGHSLGGAVASQLVQKHGAAGLILENTFNNMEDMGGVVYPLMPLGWVLRHPFASDAALKDWKGPILQFHSAADGVVPFMLGKRLSETLAERGPYVWVETGGGHNNGYQEFSSEIWSGVDRFSRLLDSPFLGRELRGAEMSKPSGASLPKATRP